MWRPFPSRFPIPIYITSSIEFPAAHGSSVVEATTFLYLTVFLLSFRVILPPHPFSESTRIGAPRPFVFSTMQYVAHPPLKLSLQTENDNDPSRPQSRATLLFRSFFSIPPLSRIPPLYTSLPTLLHPHPCLVRATQFGADIGSSCWQP